jgi:DNA-binding LytR/AlgR family response regulator
MPEDFAAFVNKTLRDEDVSKLLRTAPKLRGLIKRMYDEVRRLSGEDNDDDDDGSVFPVKTTSGTRLMRACDIFFFEAQGRKIALRTRAQEITFYSNFEQLINQLPNAFIRCHRGFIVNTRKVRSASFADNTLTMKDGSAVPISRTYRAIVRTAIDRTGGGKEL